MNILNNLTGIGNFINGNKPNQQFIIYEDAVATATDPSEYEKYIAIKFDGVDSYSYDNAVNIPTQPLENGLFTTDSVLDTPFVFRCVGVLTMAYDNNTVVTGFADIENVIDLMQTYLNNKVNLLILKNKPFYKVYGSMHLKRFTYDVTPDRLTLFANMEFMQTRTAITMDTTISVTSGTQKAIFVSNSPNVPKTKDLGLIAPANPTSSKATRLQ